ncbi:MAG: DUF3857 and transglutaminase domain-containing protein [bacterium]|nr:DUF3857 and transglutaminase domain-containing protein [bacterium]
MMKPCRLVVLALVIAGCARTTVRETLSPYQGEPQEGLTAVTFDGERFESPGMPPVPRHEVQQVTFSSEEQTTAGEAVKEAVPALSELAASVVGRGREAAGTYPGVPGVILLDDGSFTYRADGTSTYRYHFAGLILKEEAKTWAQIATGFTEGRSRVRLLFARAVSPDGEVTSLSQDALTVSSPSEAMRFFNPNRKVLSGVIPGVDVGSIIEYAYESDQYNPEDPRLFFPGYYFQGKEPVVLSRVYVEVPAETTFNYVTRNFPDGIASDPLVAEKDGVKRYVWTVEDMPPLVSEAMMPPQRDVAPMMDGSVFDSFDDVFALQCDLQTARIKLTPEIQAMVGELVAGAETVDEKIARIYYWVQTNTRYVSIKGSLGAGWSGHTAQETFDNRYGDCTDKAILFATMCEAIGVTSYPIILMTNDAGTGVTEIPTLDGNHCISEVVLEDGRSFYLDATAQNYRYPYFRADDHGAFACNAIRGDVRTIPVPPPEDNRRLSRLDLALSPKGDVSVRTRNEYNGNIEAGVRGFWKQVREDNRKMRMSSYVNSISPGAVLEDFALSDLNDLGQQLVMTIDYQLPGHAVRARDLMYMRMPTLERRFSEAALESRRYPIQYTTTEERILEMDLKLPPGYRVRWAPPPLEIASPYLEYSAAYETEGETVRFRETYRRLKRIVPVEDYAQYRDHLRTIAAFTKKELFVTEGR